MRIHFLALLFVPAVLQAAPWWNTLDEAGRASEADRRPILVEVYAPWCGYCRQMKQEIYSSPDFARRGAGFTWLTINGEADQEFSTRYRIRGFPTVLFLDYNGVELSRLEGYVSPKRFYAALEAAEKKRDLHARLVRAVNDKPDDFWANYELGDYFARAKMPQKAREYFWRAYRSTAAVSPMQRNRMLYNIAALSMRMKEFDMAASVFDAFIRNTDADTTDVIYARYWRAVALLKTENAQDRRSQIVDDLKFARKRLPFPEDREKADRLLQDL